MIRHNIALAVGLGKVSPLNRPLCCILNVNDQFFDKTLKGANELSKACVVIEI